MKPACFAFFAFVILPTSLRTSVFLVLNMLITIRVLFACDEVVNKRDNIFRAVVAVEWCVLNP